MSKGIFSLPFDYSDWLTSLNHRIQGARQRAILAVNDAQIRLYHEIGREILDRQSQQGWGAMVIDRLSTDLRSAFPQMKGYRLLTSNTCGFSLRNGRTAKLVSNLLTNCLGSIFSPSLPRSQTPTFAIGMPASLLLSLGHGKHYQSKSKTNCTCAKAPP
jgi:hypothetical protein